MDLTTDQVISLGALVVAFSAVVAGAFTTLYTSRLRRVISERWWDRKAVAYSDLLELLLDLQSEFTNARLLFEDRSGLPTPEFRLNQFATMAKTLASVERAARRGSFLVSEDTTAALASLLATCRDSTSETDPGKLYRVGEKETGAVVELVRAAAKRDLNVSGGRSG